MSHECKICADCESVSESSSDTESDDDWSDTSQGSDDGPSETESNCSYCEHERRNDDFKRYDDDGKNCDDDSENSDEDVTSDSEDINNEAVDEIKHHTRRKRFTNQISEENEHFDKNDDSSNNKYGRRRKNPDKKEKRDCEKDYDDDEKDSGEEIDEEDGVRKSYKGFDGYPPELQQFIREKHKASNKNTPNDEQTSKNEQLKALAESFGGMMMMDDDEGNNKAALKLVLGDGKLDSEDDSPTLDGGTHSRSKRHVTSGHHGGNHHKRDSHHHKNSGHHHKHGGKHHKHGAHGGKHHKHGGKHRNHGGHHRKRGDHHRRHRRSVWRMAKIVCPTGKSFALTMPARNKTGWQCGYSSKLLTLRRDGRMGRREHKIVAKEMENSKQDHNTGKFSKYDIVKVQKIVNPCLWRRYRYRRRQIIRENGSANDRLLWHGSTHVMELVDSGFDERHANPNGMFGAGLYFATNSSKSNQYVYPAGCPAHKAPNCHACERNILLCRVSLGKVQQYTTAHKVAHPPVGYHSVEGVPGTALKYSENIVYRGEQIYPEFLITYKLVP